MLPADKIVSFNPLNNYILHSLPRKPMARRHPRRPLRWRVTKSGFHQVWHKTHISSTKYFANMHVGET